MPVLEWGRDGAVRDRLVPNGSLCGRVEVAVSGGEAAVRERAVHFGCWRMAVVDRCGRGIYW